MTPCRSAAALGCGALVAAVLVAAACVRPAATPGGGRSDPAGSPVAVAAPGDAVRATVVRVVDGDTLTLSGLDVGRRDRPSGTRRARLIGVDAPEAFGPTECLGDLATSFSRDRLEGRRVLIAFDSGATDRFGRALVYLWPGRGDELFNATLLREGYATLLTVPPNVRYARLFATLERDARGNARGLWGGACGTRLEPRDGAREQRR